MANKVKYHISPTTGRPNICSAAKGNCPYGGDEEHFSSKEKARAAYEKKMSGKTLVSHGKASESKKQPKETPQEKSGIKRLPEGETRDYTEMLRKISARKAAAREEMGNAYFEAEVAEIFCSKCGEELKGYSKDGLCGKCRKAQEEDDFVTNNYDEPYWDEAPRRVRRSRKSSDGWDDPDEDDDEDYLGAGNEDEDL